jgi:predicted transcriptional regulator of viral defense system
MKSRKNLLEQLKNLPYFGKDTVHQLGNQLRLKEATIDTYISRFLKYKEIIKLKRGLYISADFYDKNKTDISYLFYLANIIRKPSYVSSWTALQYYNLTTESIYGITSVTQKPTRNYDTKISSFSYQSIQEKLFVDFSSVEGKFNFFIASPAKALFDLLYFKTHQFRGIKKENIKLLIEKLRIDINEMDKNEQDKFYIMINKYLNHE